MSEQSSPLGEGAGSPTAGSGAGTGGPRAEGAAVDNGSPTRAQSAAVVPPVDVNASPRKRHHSRKSQLGSMSVPRSTRNTVKLLHRVHLHGMDRPQTRQAGSYFGVQGIDFSRHDNELGDAVVAAPQSKRGHLIAALSPWLVVLCLGFATSVLTNAALAVTAVIEGAKVALVKSILKSDAPSTSGASAGDAATWLVAWCAWAGIGVVLVLGAALCVLYAPAAQSSGIPMLLAFLNGAKPARQRSLLVRGLTVSVFGLRTLGAKFVSTILAVSSGLFLGPEGPLIHMGAIVGRLVHRLGWLHAERSMKVTLAKDQEARQRRSHRHARAETLDSFNSLAARYQPKSIDGGATPTSLKQASAQSAKSAPGATTAGSSGGPGRALSPVSPAEHMGPGALLRQNHYNPHADASGVAAGGTARPDASIPQHRPRHHHRHSVGHHHHHHHHDHHRHDITEVVEASGGFGWLPELGSRSEQERDAVAVGAGAAIAAAFSAPLAGVMFVLEEASSKVTLRCLEWAFVACAAAFVVTWSINDTPSGAGHVKFDVPVSPLCTSYSAGDAFVFVAIAVLGGCLGAAFNEAVVRTTKWRLEHISPVAWRRVAEAVLLLLVTASVCVGLPAMWGCRELRPQLMMEGATGCLLPKHWAQLSPALSPRADAARLYAAAERAAKAGVVSTDGIAVLTPQEWAWAEKTLGTPVEREPGMGPLDVRPSDLIYLARNMSALPYIQVGLSHAGACGVGYFNQLASLLLMPGVKAVTLLLTRGMPLLFSHWALLAFLSVYTPLAAYTAGVSVAAGLFVPHLLIGAAMGRLVGLLELTVVTSACVPPPPAGVDPSTMSVAAWSLSGYRESLADCGAPDPGTFALIGAAAVMGGSGRITVFLAVVMLELTADVTFMPVIAVTVVIAMWIGNLFNHGLYHSLIPLAGVPFLPRAPHPAQATQPVVSVMAKNVVTLQPRMTAEDAEAVLYGLRSVLPPPGPPTRRRAKRGAGEGVPARGTPTAADVVPSAPAAGAVPPSPSESDTDASETSDSDVSDSPSDGGDSLESSDSGGSVGEKCRMGTLTTHSCFPVVTPTGHVIGLVDKHMLQRAVDQARRRRREASKRRKLGDADVGVGVSVGIGAGVKDMTYEAELNGDVIDMMAIMHRAPYVISELSSVARAYDLFRSLGLRHLCVIGDDGRLTGMLTRKDLMAWRLLGVVHKVHSQRHLHGHPHVHVHGVRSQPGAVKVHMPAVIETAGSGDGDELEVDTAADVRGAGSHGGHGASQAEAGELPSTRL